MTLSRFIWRKVVFARRGKNPAPNPDPGQLTDRTEEPDIYPPVEIVPGFDMDEPCEICEFNYNEVSEVLDAARKYIPGYFTEELTSEEIVAIIPDRKASDMTFYGYAGFDGEGTLIDVVLKVNAPFLNDADVTVLFSYDEPFRCYEIQDEPVDSKLNGYDFEVYKWISDSGTIYYDAFGHINGCAIHPHRTMQHRDYALALALLQQLLQCRDGCTQFGIGRL